MHLRNRFMLASLMAISGLLFTITPAQSGRTQALTRNMPARGSMIVKNSWHGITPLQSSTQDVERVIGVDVDLNDATVGGPFKVEDGEVTFSFLTPSLAKIYRAPRTLIGKVFTIYVKPNDPMTRAELKLGPGFRQCKEQQVKGYYYLVNDAGVAYRIRHDDDSVEAIIYQPSRAEVRRLAVNTECVF